MGSWALVQTTTLHRSREGRWRALRIRAMCGSLVLASAVACGCGNARTFGDSDTVGSYDNRDWTPPDAIAELRRDDIAARFGLENTFEVSFQVNNAFSAENRRAIARAEALMVRIPGVRRVAGPSGLLMLSVGLTGKANSAPLLVADGPPTVPVSQAAFAEAQEEVLRQRIERRPDAAGWFVSRDGTEIRFVLNAALDESAVGNAVEAAVAASGLTRLSGSAAPMRVWPKPDRESFGVSPWLVLLAVLTTASLFLIPALYIANAGLVRVAIAAALAGVGAMSPAVFAPVSPLRAYSFGIGLVTAAWVMGWSRVASLRSRRGPRGHLRLLAPSWIGVPSAILVIFVLATWARVGVATRLWRGSSLAFVSVQGNMEEPVVLRELRRISDVLRAQPGVAEAWSIANAIDAVTWSPSEQTGIPDSAKALRSILQSASQDSAVGLLLAADHREALIALRFDDDAGIDRLTLESRLREALLREGRSHLLRVDLADPMVPLAAKGFARGILVADSRDRVLRICARSGSSLGEDDVATTERLIRRSALVPGVDLPRLRLDLEQGVYEFLETVAVAERNVALPRPGIRQHLAAELAAEPWQSSVADVLRVIAAAGVGRKLEAALKAHAPDLQRRLDALRRQNAGRLSARTLLAELDLPREGVVSEQIRDVTLEAMGPIVGVPVSADRLNAFAVDVSLTGGVAQDAALSRAWLPRFWLGIGLAALLMALGLIAVGGVPALGWLPVALAPGAAVLVAPLLGAVSIGIWPISILAGAMGGGMAFATLFAPKWNDL